MGTNFIIEEFNLYKVFLYGRKHMGRQTYYGIDLTLPSGTAYLRFSENDERENHVVKRGEGKYYFHIFLDRQKFPKFIDILRNEKPLFFFYNFDDDSTYITTSDEPVGENEDFMHVDSDD